MKLTDTRVAALLLVLDRSVRARGAVLVRVISTSAGFTGDV
jgi:hypothetical protein